MMMNSRSDVCCRSQRVGELVTILICALVIAVMGIAALASEPLRVESVVVLVMSVVIIGTTTGLFISPLRR